MKSSVTAQMAIETFIQCIINEQYLRTESFQNQLQVLEIHSRKRFLYIMISSGVKTQCHISSYVSDHHLDKYHIKNYSVLKSNLAATMITPYS